MLRRETVLSLMFAAGLVFSVAAPAFFTLNTRAVETVDPPKRQRPKPEPKKVRCSREYFLTTRDGKTVYVDKHGRECL